MSLTEIITSVPSWVYDWTGGTIFMVSLYYFFYKSPRAWHWSNATLVPYFLLFIATGMWMLAGLQVIYLMFGIHGWILWRLQEKNNRWAPAWERLAVPFGVVIFVYSISITQFEAVMIWLQFAITALSILGSVLLVLKYPSSWLVYIAANVVGLIYYPSNGLWALTIVQVGAIIMSVQGYRIWKKEDVFMEELTEKKGLA